MQSLIKVKVDIIESACRAAIKLIDFARLQDKTEQIDLLMKDEQSFFEKVLGHKPNILTREDAEKDLIEYAEKKGYAPVSEFMWVHYKKDDYKKANLFLDVCHLAEDDVMLLTLDDAAFIQNYLKKL